MKLKFKILTITFLLLAQSGYVLSQDKSVYENMTLEEILDIDVVVTTSKQPEDLFETPLSTTIISKEEIAQSGVTSIPEALRLSQGVIVREITPGNYDIHIRGYDEITKNVYLTLSYNSTTLVMIDNRIMYSYFGGGTFWETFPVDINDVEGIEIVRGPTSALYGPNAVTGVINIITSHAHKKGQNVAVNTSVGTNKTKMASVNFGYNWDNKTKLSLSVNFSERHRFDEGYYDFTEKDYTSIDDLTMFASPIRDFDTNDVWTFEEYQEELGAYYDVDLSLRKAGGNIFFSHLISEKSNIEVAVGAQKSQSQKIGFLNLSTPLSQSNSESYYLNSRIKHNNFSGQLNINSGEDKNNYKYNTYKFTDVDVNLEYFKQFKSVSVRPGINYKYLSYNSPAISEEPLDFNTLDNQFRDKPRVTSSYSAFVLSEWKPTHKLRLIGAVRVDKFEFNKNYFTNFEIASTYRINKNNFVRATFSKASKSPFFFDSYLNSSMVLKYDKVDDITQEVTPVPILIEVNGQENLKYPTISNFEIGWRAKLAPKLNLDVEMFYSIVDNFVNPNVYHQITTVEQLDDAGVPESTISTSAYGNAIFENYALEANQYGAGFTLSYDVSDTFTAKVFGTYQHTNINGKKDISLETTGIDIQPISSDNTQTTVVSTTVNPTQWNDDATPSFFGGFLLNYNSNKKWSFSTDGYFYSNNNFTNHKFYDISDASSIDAAKLEMKIKSNLILNAKTSYKLNENLQLSFTAKNIFGDHREFGFADNIGTTLLLGFQFTY